jgi:hypothetical protein
MNVRASGICGVLFAITFTVGVILLGDLLGSFADSDETFAEYYASSANRTGSALGGLLLLISGIAFLPFVGGLVRLIDPNHTSWTTVQLGVPLSYVAAGLIIAAAAALSTVGFAGVFADIIDGSLEAFQGSSVAVLPQLGYVLIVLAAWVLAVVLAIVASVSMRARSMPRALAWLTMVCATLLLLAPSVAALLAIPIWALATSVVMLRRQALAEA